MPMGRLCLFVLSADPARKHSTTSFGAVQRHTMCMRPEIEALQTLDYQDLPPLLRQHGVVTAIALRPNGSVE